MSDDPRFTDYWAAIRADLSKQTVDAVIRKADAEQADLRARIEGLEAALRFKDGTIEDLSALIEGLRDMNCGCVG